MAQPWSFSFAFGDIESDSENETNVATVPQVVQSPSVAAEHQLSKDARLALDLDLSTRQDTVEFRKTPWTIARSNAALRPTRTLSVTKASEPSLPPRQSPNASNAVYDVKNRAPVHVLRDNSTTHARAPKPGPSVQQDVRTGARALFPENRAFDVTMSVEEKNSTPQQSPRPFQPRQIQTPKKYPFVSPLKHLAQPPVRLSLPYGRTEYTELSTPIRSMQSTVSPHRFVASLPTVTNRSPVEMNTIPPSVKPTRDRFYAASLTTPSIPFTPIKRKRDSSPLRPYTVLSHERKSPLPANKRAHTYSSPSPPPRSKPFVTPMRKEREVSAYKDEVFNTSGDETWSTLPTKKKLPTKNMNTFAKGKLTTGVFKLPGLGIPKSLAAASKRSPQPKVTMLTLYQPPPLPSKTRRRSLKSNKQAASDASGEIVSGTSGSSDGDHGHNTEWELKAVSWSKDDSHTEEVQSDFPCWEDDEELPSTVQEKKRGNYSNRDDTLARPGVPPNDPYGLK